MTSATLRCWVSVKREGRRTPTLWIGCSRSDGWSRAIASLRTPGREPAAHAGPTTSSYSLRVAAAGPPRGLPRRPATSASPGRTRADVVDRSAFRQGGARHLAGRSTSGTSCSRPELSPKRASTGWGPLSPRPARRGRCSPPMSGVGAFSIMRTAWRAALGLTEATRGNRGSRSAHDAGRVGEVTGRTGGRDGARARSAPRSFGARRAVGSRWDARGGLRFGSSTGQSASFRSRAIGSSAAAGFSSPSRTSR
jgi:hypothetical protein